MMKGNPDLIKAYIRSNYKMNTLDWLTTLSLDDVIEINNELNEFDEGAFPFVYRGGIKEISFEYYSYEDIYHMLVRHGDLRRGYLNEEPLMEDGCGGLQPFDEALLIRPTIAKALDENEDLLLKYVAKYTPHLSTDVELGCLIRKLTPKNKEFLLMTAKKLEHQED